MLPLLILFEGNRCNRDKACFEVAAAVVVGHRDNDGLDNNGLGDSDDVLDNGNDDEDGALVTFGDDIQHNEDGVKDCLRAGRLQPS